MSDTAAHATSADVDREARALYGELLGPMRGVLHVMALAREGGALVAPKIGPHSPASDTDRFALQLSRARVDAIVLGGGVVRDEPELVYDGGAPGFRALRQHAPPWLVVLTRGGELPREHPIWTRSWARPLVVTTPDVRVDLPSRVEVARLADLTPRALLAHLFAERGCAGVSIEAGPSIAAPLYDEPSAIDEAMLSVFEGSLDPRARGARLLDEAALAGRMRLVSERARVEASGPWRFRRYLRA